MEEFLKHIATINWIIGLLLGVLSNAGSIIQPNKVERKGWRKYKIYYSIKEIKFVIKNSEDEAKIQKLKRKILYRRLYPIFLISTIVLIVIANLLVK